MENAGYRASERNTEFFQNKMKWLGHEIDEDGIKPKKEKSTPYWIWNTGKTRNNWNLFLGQNSIRHNSYQDCQKEPTNYENY